MKRREIRCRSSPCLVDNASGGSGRKGACGMAQLARLGPTYDSSGRQRGLKRSSKPTEPYCQDKEEVQRMRRPIWTQLRRLAELECLDSIVCRPKPNHDAISSLGSTVSSIYT